MTEDQKLENRRIAVAAVAPIAAIIFQDTSDDQIKRINSISAFTDAIAAFLNDGTSLPLEDVVYPA
jgi:hypothetical protein